jgi:hypothetical protein
MASAPITRNGSLKIIPTPVSNAINIVMKGKSEDKEQRSFMPSLLQIVELMLLYLLSRYTFPQ